MSNKCVIPYGVWALLAIGFVKDGSEACTSRFSWNALSSNKNNEILPQRENPLVLDKDTVSVVEQTLIKTLIEMGKLKFHCPKDDGFYVDMLDCRRYYECDNGTFTTHECEKGTGFEPNAKSCVMSESVPLCQRVQRLEGHECNGTGLETLPGHCEKFVLCTGEAAYTSSCHRGDLFDQKLKLCLPEQDVNNCDFESKNADNKTVTK